MKRRWQVPLIMIGVTITGCATTSTDRGFERIISSDQSMPTIITTTQATSQTIGPTPPATSTITLTAVSPPTRPSPVQTVARPKAHSSSTWIPTAFLSPTGTPSSTPRRSATATLTKTPLVPRANPDALVRPPPDVTLNQHLVLGRPAGAGGNNWPSSLYRYGMTWDGSLIPHHGVDMANDAGVPIVSVGAGTVHHAGSDLETIFAFRHDFYGNLIVLRMANGWNGHTIYALYGHLDTITVSTGQEVEAGEVIGTTGGTGAAFAPHLHFEIRIDTPTSYWSVRNPELWYRPMNDSGVLAGRVLDHHNRFIPGQHVIITCQDGIQRNLYTYWDQGTPPDDVMFENFAISDLPPGNCSAETSIDGHLLQDRVEIISGHVSFLVIRPHDK